MKVILPALMAGAAMSIASIQASAAASAGTTGAGTGGVTGGGTSSAGTLIFQSGFEPGTTLESGNNSDLVKEISGTDNSVSPPNNWGSSSFETFLYGTWGGTGDAAIIAEPEKPTNHVMRFRVLRSANEWNRVQQIFTGIGDEVYYSVRVKYPEHIKQLLSYPGTFCGMVSEFYNDAPDGYCSRIPLEVCKTSGGTVDKLDFHSIFYSDSGTCHSGSGYSYTWEKSNPAIPVPIGKWFTLEYYLKDGDRNTGRYFVAITPEGGARQVLFDVRDATSNTTKPADGFNNSWLQPMKLYNFNDEVVDWMASRGYIQVYFDDFKVYKNRSPL